MLFQPLADKIAEQVTQEIAEVSVPASDSLSRPRSEKLCDVAQSSPTSETEQSINAVAAEQCELEQKDVAEDHLWENQRPPWAQQQFDCLLFNVCGFNFAVPLVTLGQIQMITANLSPVFGQAPWFMGIQTTPLGQWRLVNTAQFVMPERYQPNKQYQPTYMISIANCHWALAVDAVDQPITLSPDDVKWRSDRRKQQWLAGVVKQHMCVLIDVPALAKELKEADKNSQKSPVNSH